MRWEKLISLIIIVALVIGGAYFAAKPIQENVKLGLDLKGGVQVRLQAKALLRIETSNRSWKSCECVWTSLG